MPGAIQSIERAAAILQLIADNPAELGLSEIATTLDLAKPTAHGLLRTLQSIGYVQQDEQDAKYRLGDVLLGLGTDHLDPNELRSHAVNWSDSLASRSGESVRLAVLADRNRSVRVVHHVFRPDDSAQRLDVGTVLPAHASALGKVILAWSPALAPRGRRELDAFTSHTVTSTLQLARNLVEVRKRGWAADIEELTMGTVSIAAPVRRSQGQVVGAIGIAGPLDRLCDSRGRPRPHLVDQVCDCARSVSRDLATARR